MCIDNISQSLAAARRRTSPIVAWKVVDLCEVNGTEKRITRSPTDKITEWKSNAVVKADKRLKPLKQGEQASHGLYFFTKQPPYNWREIAVDEKTTVRIKCTCRGTPNEELIKVTIQPQHVIAKGCFESGKGIIVATQAKTQRLVDVKELTEVSQLHMYLDNKANLKREQDRLKELEQQVKEKEDAIDSIRDNLELDPTYAEKHSRGY